MVWESWTEQDQVYPASGKVGNLAAGKTRRLHGSPLAHATMARKAGLNEVAYKRGTFFFYRLVPEAVEALAFALGGSSQPELVLATADGTVAR